jgi:hypothetical protein
LTGCGKPIDFFDFSKTAIFNHSKLFCPRSRGLKSICLIFGYLVVKPSNNK